MLGYIVVGIIASTLHIHFKDPILENREGIILTGVIWWAVLLIYGFEWLFNILFLDIPNGIDNFFIRIGKNGKQ